jgi:hypothetical protein
MVNVVIAIIIEQKSRSWRQFNMPQIVNVVNTDRLGIALSPNLVVALGLVPKYPLYVMCKLAHIPVMGCIVVRTRRLGCHTVWSLSPAWCTETLTTTPRRLSTVSRM